MILKALLVLSLSVVSLFEFDHDPNLATVTIKKEKGVWFFTISCAQAGLHQAVITNYPELKNTPITDKTYKEAVVDYLKKTVELTANDFREVTLGKGGVRLGSHQSDMKFELQNMPDDIRQFKIVVRSMNENVHHVNLVKIYSEEGPRTLFLNSANKFEESIDFSEQKR